MRRQRQPHHRPADRRDYRTDTWQSALRKQYLKRDPDANPLGPEPPAPSRLQSVDPGTPAEDQEEEAPRQTSEAADAPELVNGHDHATEVADTPSAPPANGAEQDAEGDTAPAPAKQEEDVSMDTKQEPDSEIPTAESKNWLDLSMQEKLDSMHLLTEWQFQTPQRLRSIMKDDGEHARWVSSCIASSLLYFVTIAIHSESSPLGMMLKRMRTG